MGEPPWRLLAPLAAGAPLTPGWRVADLSAVMAGSAVLTVAQPGGATQRVHICRNSGRPQGMAFTRACDLLIMNGARGTQPTDEPLARAVAMVAAAIARNESDPANLETLSAMKSHDERLRLYDSRQDARLR